MSGLLVVGTDCLQKGASTMQVHKALSLVLGSGPGFKSYQHKQRILQDKLDM